MAMDAVRSSVFPRFDLPVVHSPMVEDGMVGGRGVSAGRHAIRLGPWDLLVGVAGGEAACAELFGRWLVDHPQGRQVPEEFQLDVLHDVFVRFIDGAAVVVASIRDRRSGPPEEMDRRLHAYVARAITNRLHSVRRVRRREVPLEWARPLEADGPCTGGAFDVGLRVMTAVEERVLALAPKPAEARRTLDELRDLALGARTMAEVVAAELAHDPGGDFGRARSRLYVRHRRMRDALLNAVAEMQRAGELHADEVALACWVVKGLLTRRVRRAS